ncbi:MAG: PfkB family carbohydrate kinase [Gemmatimonadota bacterium]|nr:PfkB family carbohydrate kinase [Gemmatimonadota bacterium]
MSVLVVGSVALDTVETPFARAERVPGGSAVFFGAAASFFTEVRVVGVVGDDYPMHALAPLEARGVDLRGIERAAGESFFWEGKYSYDLNSRETLETRLGVFGDFSPTIPDSYRDSDVVFLGNIDPTLQLRVLEQIPRPRLVGADTMNFWIEGTREPLIELLGHLDILFVNDEEARQLAGEVNLAKAARWIQDRGPGMVVIKKGEHGAILFADGWVFFTPGYPLEVVFDPTGAGDAFAGGFMGYLDFTGGQDPDNLRRAMVHGSTMGSYAVESFSIDRLADLSHDEVAGRVRTFREMTSFELDLSATDP